MTNEFITSEVDRIRTKYHSTDPYEILEAMKVVTIYSDRYPHSGLKGFCTIANRTQYVLLNAKLSDEEMRVVAAHELGHIVLHMPELRFGTFKDSDVYNATGRLEREANLFAADLIITDEAAEESIAECEADFFSAASTLCVPAPFLTFKLFSMAKRGFPMRLPLELDSRFLGK